MIKFQINTTNEKLTLDLPIWPRRDTAFLWVEGHKNILPLTLLPIPARSIGFVPESRPQKHLVVAVHDDFPAPLFKVLETGEVVDRDEQFGINLVLGVLPLYEKFGGLGDTRHPLVVHAGAEEMSYYASEHDWSDWQINLRKFGIPAVDIGSFGDLGCI